MADQFLFVCGCPRSGTTALTHILNWHPRIVLGIERFAALFRRAPQRFTPELFEIDRFSEIRQGDCGYGGFLEFPAYSNSWASPWDPQDIATAAWVGDKITQLYQSFDVFEGEAWAGKDMVIVQIIRSVFDVARSYEARLLDPSDKWSFSYRDGILEWSEAIEKGLQIAEGRGRAPRFIVVNYERLFESGESAFVDGCATLVRAIGLGVPPRFQAGLKKVFRAGEGVLERRVSRGGMVANEDIAEHLTPRALENYKRLRALALF